MSIILPTVPAVRSARPMVLSFGSVLTPFLGGPSQRINRLGTRWALRVSMPPMPAEMAAPWVAGLAQGVEAGGIMRLPQDIAIGTPGTPRISAAVTAGMVLPLMGLTPGYTVKIGQWLSIIHGGQRYVHMVSAPGTANAAGNLSVSIWPMIRTGLSVNDVVEMSQPMIEGLLDGNFEWDMLTAPWVQLPEFTITERA